MSETTINEIDELKNSFIENLAPARIYLFGSYVEGKQTEESDFDFYIVVNDIEKDMIELTARAYKSIRHKQKRSVDIIVNSESVFNSKKDKVMTIEKEVFQKGVLLYGT